MATKKLNSKGKWSKKDLAAIRKRIQQISTLEGKDIEKLLREDSKSVLAADVSVELQFPIFLKTYFKDAESAEYAELRKMLRQFASYWYGFGMKHDEHMAQLLEAIGPEQ